MFKSQLRAINWQKVFSPTVYKRALNYFHDDKVLDCQVTKLDEMHLKLVSVVKGSYDNDYITNINFEKNGENGIRINALCGCPVGVNCKHILATILHYMSTETEDAKPKDDVLPDYLHNWMHRIQHTQEESTLVPTLDTTYGLYFSLKKYTVSPTSHLIIEPLLIRHLKAGGFGASKSYSLTAAGAQTHLDEHDKLMIANLETGKKLSRDFSSGHYTLKTPFDEETLIKLLATNKCFWHKDYDLPLTLGPAIPLELKWHRQTNGDVVLQVFSSLRNCHYFTIDKMWYYDTHKQEIGLVEHQIPHPILQELLRMPPVKNVDIAALQTFLQKENLAQHVPLPEKMEEKIIDQITPIPCFRIFTEQHQIKEYGYSETIEMIMGELCFDYQGHLIPWNTRESKIEVQQENLLIHIIRNSAAEANARVVMDSFKIPLMEDIYHLSRSQKKYSHFYSLDFQEDVHFEITKYVVPELIKLGWRVTYAENYPYHLIENQENWYSEIHEDASHDWFNLELGIEIDGKKVNLLPILYSFLQNHKLSDLDNEETFYLKISDQEFMPFESSRLKPIVETLIHLNQFNQSKDNQLQLSKYHASRLLELESAIGATQLRWFGGQKIRDLGQRLSKFTGIDHIKPPAGFTATLRSYQQEGLDWLQFLRKYELGGILADDMGLGKTIQTLAHICKEKEEGRMQTPCLVIAPTSLMFNWQMESRKFAPELKVLTLHGNERKEFYADISRHDLILTTYPLIVRDKEILLQHQFHLLILDEAQCIKNANTLTTQVALQLQAKHRICLTGTPMENHLGELWSQFHFLMPGLLGDSKSFNKHFKNPIEKNGDVECHQRLQKIIKPFILRRTKALVATELPEKTEMIRYVQLSGKQRDLYETIRISMHNKIQDEISRLGFARSQIVILDALLKLRQVCCDPRLVKSAKQTKKIESAKLNELSDLTETLIQENRRILIFSQFTEMLKLIEETFNEKNIAYVKLTGQTKKRQEVVQAFQEGNVPVFLISLKAGGVGLNLTAADTVIHYDPWWNPAAENQATDRAYRIGQNKQVMVYKLVAKDTIEDKILLMQERKSQLINGVLEHQTNAKFGISESEIEALFAQI